MKRLHIAAGFALMLLAAACGSTQSTTTSSFNDSYTTSNMAVVTASPAAIAAFTAENPDAGNVVWYSYDARLAPVDWELTAWQPLTTNDYVVSYDWNGNKYYSWYDAGGNWVGNTYALSDYSLLPVVVTTNVKTDYPAYTITNVQNTSWRDHSAYQVEMNDGVTKTKILYDANGNVIKKKSMALK